MSRFGRFRALVDGRQRAAILWWILGVYVAVVILSLGFTGGRSAHMGVFGEAATPTAVPAIPTTVDEGPVVPTSLRCVDVPSCGEECHAENTDVVGWEHTCLLSDLYFHDGRFYVVREHAWSEMAWPPIRLTTRRDTRSAWVVGVDTLGDTVADRVRGPVHVVDKVVVVGQRIYPNNHGHVLLDFDVAALLAMQLLGVLTKDNVVVLADPGAPARWTDVHVALITDHPVVKVHGDTSALCPPGAWCRLPRVVAGLGGLGFFFDETQLAMRVAAHRTLRAWAWDTCEVSGGGGDAWGLGAHEYRVVLAQRRGSRVIPHMDRVAARTRAVLAAALPDKDVRLEVVFFEDLSLCQQVRLMHRTSLLIGIDGTAMDNCMFMRNDTAVFALSGQAYSHHESFLPLFSRFLTFHLHYLRAPDYTDLGAHREEFERALLGVLGKAP